MRDLTRGPVAAHVFVMAVPIAIGMLLQTLYYIVDLYFVAQLGDAALAGVGAAGNIMYVVLALTQTLGVGTVALMSHAVGRGDRGDANHVFNQSVASTMIVQSATVVLNAILAPVLIAGWGTSRPLGVAGAVLVNTWPALASSVSRLLLFAVPAMWLSTRAGFRLVDVWHLSVATVLMQAVLSVTLLRRELRVRLGDEHASAAPAA